MPTSASAPHAASKRRLPFVSRDRNFSSSSNVSASGCVAARLLADFSSSRNNLDVDEDDFHLDDDDDDDDDLDYDDELGADAEEASGSRVSWEARKFPLVGEDLDDLGPENGEANGDDVWFGDSVRLVVRGAARGRFASETAISLPFRKTEIPSRSGSLDRSTTSLVNGPGGDASSVIHQNGDSKIAPPLTPSSTSG